MRRRSTSNSLRDKTEPECPSELTNSSVPMKQLKRYCDLCDLAGIFKVSLFTFLLVTALIQCTTLQFESSPSGSGASNDILVSVVVLTYQKHDLLSDLLTSVIHQKPGFVFEVIVVDNGCIPETREVVEMVFHSDVEVPHKFLPLCTNPGYAVGNNEGARLAAASSKWILLLNDDLFLNDQHFISNMVRLGEAKTHAGGVGCKLLTVEGDALIESGSIIWADGSTAGYGRGREDFEAPEFFYPYPVDYVSGACLLVDRDIFDDYKGFQHKLFPNYFEDTDLQMHIQHDLNKEVWLQPLAIALHAEHASFGKSDSSELMNTGKKRFKGKWNDELKEHVPTPFHLSEQQQHLEFLRAGDIRGRKPDKANILYFDMSVPNPKRGSGYGRSYDNLSIIAELGHRVTLISYHTNTDDWCDHDCRQDILDWGIEVVTGPWEAHVKSRVGFYDIVVISRPTTFRLTYEKWREFYLQHPFTVVYDCEALEHRRDEKLIKLRRKGIDFPGAKGLVSQPSFEAVLKEQKLHEVSLFAMADVVLPVSEEERRIVMQISPNVDSYVIGHVMNPKKITANSFHQRNGILFIASFSEIMYYNGDAIWYFVTEIYPLILKEVSIPIPLTIAGRGIPSELREIISKNPVIARHVTFIESPPSLEALYEVARVFIAPHLYGAGIQFKLSEAFAMGLPVVAAPLAAKSFGLEWGDKVACVGKNTLSFKDCVIQVHSDEERWKELRSIGIDFIRSTHSRSDTMRTWSKVIEGGIKKIKILRDTKDRCDRLDEMMSLSTVTPTEACVDGEEFYKWKYTDVNTLIETRRLESAFQHWVTIGKAQSRLYPCGLPDLITFWRRSCKDASSMSYMDHGLVTSRLKYETAACPEGETNYFFNYPDVEAAFKAGIYENGFQHWNDGGKVEGRRYVCHH